ncbi:hypothetical protein RCL1_002982 [Eukaryota sp. TZLM3-RCL]
MGFSGGGSRSSGRSFSGSRGGGSRTGGFRSGGRSSSKSAQGGIGTFIIALIVVGVFLIMAGFADDGGSITSISKSTQVLPSIGPIEKTIEFTAVGGSLYQCASEPLLSGYTDWFSWAVKTLYFGAFQKRWFRFNLNSGSALKVHFNAEESFPHMSILPDEPELNNWRNNRYYAYIQDCQYEVCTSPLDFLATTTFPELYVGFDNFDNSTFSGLNVRFNFNLRTHSKTSCHATPACTFPSSTCVFTGRDFVGSHWLFEAPADHEVTTLKYHIETETQWALVFAGIGLIFLAILLCGCVCFFGLF